MSDKIYIATVDAKKVELTCWEEKDISLAEFYKKKYPDKDFDPKTVIFEDGDAQTEITTFYAVSEEYRKQAVYEYLSERIKKAVNLLGGIGALDIPDNGIFSELFNKSKSLN